MDGSTNLHNDFVSGLVIFQTNTVGRIL